VNDEGQTITLEGMAKIEQRHDRKSERLAEMRQERASQYADRHAHVGVEIGRDLADLSLMAEAHQALASMANGCALAGKHVAGRTFASLANGIARAAVEMYGKGADEQLATYDGNVPGVIDGFDADGVEYVAGQAPGVPLAEANQSLDEIAAAIRGDDESEPHDALNVTDTPALSPEPDETPQRRAARLRREAKRLAETARAEANAD
jgi:hypothetical protein